MAPLSIVPARSSDSRHRPMRVRLTVDQFWELWEAGHFGDKRVELLDGEVYEMASQGNPHAIGVTLVSDALKLAFGPAYWVRGQATVRMSDTSAPDPDVCVVAGSPSEWMNRPLPTDPLLVVEVSETTLRLDRRKKARIYAAAGVKDYWILRVSERLLEVRRRPVEDAKSPTGWDYGEVDVLDATLHVAPLARPDVSIAVADLLPKLPA